MEAVTRLANGEGSDVLSSAAAGDEIAFRQIIAAHHEDMRRVCLAISGDGTIAEGETVVVEKVEGLTVKVKKVNASS